MLVGSLILRVVLVSVNVVVGVIPSGPMIMA